MGSLQPHRRAAVECGLRFRDQLAVEDVVDLVILRLAFEDRGYSAPPAACSNSLREIEALGPSSIPPAACWVEHLHLADHLVEM